MAVMIFALALLASAFVFEAPVSSLRLRERDLDFPPSAAVADTGESGEQPLSHILVTSYASSAMGTGKLWVISLGKPQEPYTLLSGLGLEVGCCYDHSHDFLYVFDRDFSATGRIYRYAIRRRDGQFELLSSDYFLIFEGRVVTSCGVDRDGNVYFTARNVSTVYAVRFADAWSGYRNQEFALYSGDRDWAKQPMALEVTQDSQLFWVNAGELNLTRAVVTAPTRRNPGNPPTVVRTEGQSPILSISVSKSLFSRSFSTGSILTTRRSATESAFLSWPRSLCHSRSQIYVGDSDLSAVFTLTDSESPFPIAIARISDLADIECIQGNAAIGAVFVTLLLALV